jgi:hypothetical protein
MPRPTADPAIVVALEKVRAAVDALRTDTTRDDLMMARDNAIAAAAKAGAQKQAIASISGVSRQRVGQIVQENETSA